MSILGSQRRVSAPALGRPLWSADDVRRWRGLVVGGAVLVIVGWHFASGRTHFSQALSYVNVAVIGILVAGLGHAMLLLRGRRAVGERRRAMLGDTVGADDPHLYRAELSQMPAAGSVADGPLIAGEGMSRFHRAGCPLARDRDWPDASKEEHVAAGRSACGVCRP